jgi:DNA-binding CsgD family transcriptional regulator
MAVRLLLEAADAALSRGAPETAVVYLRRALQDAGDHRVELLHTLGVAESRLRDPRAREHLLAAYADATGGERAAIAVDTARALVGDLRVDQASNLLHRTIAETPMGDREARLRLLAELVATEVLGGRLTALPDPLPAGETRAERALLSSASMMLLTQVDTATDPVELARAAWGDGLLLAEEGPDSTSMQFAVGALILGDVYDEALKWLCALIEEARRRGSTTTYVLALSIRSYANHRRGDVGEALADARMAMEAEAAYASGVFTPIATTFLLEALIESGELSEAEEALSTHGLDGALPQLYTFDILLARRGRLRLAQGEYERALDDLLEACRRLAWFTNPVDTRRVDAAAALRALDRRDEARDLVAEELELAKRAGRPRALAIAERAAALLEQPPDLARLERSAQLASTAGAQLEQARALADLGAATRRSGQRVRARKILHDALDLASRCGATGLFERAHEELSAAGGRMRHVELTGVRSLTPSELRVARMAVDGKSNREIAQALFLTVRTIEMHLSDAYRKLEICSRDELASALENDQT